MAGPQRHRDPRSDQALIAATRDGDAKAFGALFRRHRALVLAYCARRTGPEAAADLTAEVFAAALVALRDGDGPPVERVASWLLTIARNKLIDSVRRGRVQDAARAQLAFEPVVLHDRDLERVIDAAGDEAINALLAGLSPDERAAVRARVLDEREYADIARELRCSEAVIRQRVSRGLRRLRAALPRGMP